MAKAGQEYYRQRTTGMKFPVEDRFCYPDTLIRARTDVAYQLGTQFVPSSPDTVMDYGSGGGHGILTINTKLNPRRIISLDRHQPYLVVQEKDLHRRGLTNVEFINSGTVPHSVGGLVDAIFFMHVIEHMKDPGGQIMAMGQLMSPDGRLVVATPNQLNLVGHNPDDDHIYVRSELRSLLEAAGFAAKIYHIIPNEFAWRVHNRKKWLARYAPFTDKLRRKVPWQIWDRSVLRIGITEEPLTSADFKLSQDPHPRAIDLLAVAHR